MVLEVLAYTFAIMTILICALSVLLGGGAFAQGSTRAELAMAGVQGGGWDATGFARFYDAARIGLGAGVVRPPEARLDQRVEAARPAPSTRPARRFDDPRLVVPAPVVTPEYQRTFRILLAHPEVTDRYDELILKSARANRLDARLLKSIIAAESEFAIGALSPRGARGLMQVMPRTAEEVGVPASRLRDAGYNIAAGAAYLAVLFAAAWKRYKLKGVRYHQAPLWLKQRIIAAYNAGPKFLFREHGWYKQTRNYVRKVLLFYNSPVTDIRRGAAVLTQKPALVARPTSGTLY